MHFASGKARLSLAYYCLFHENDLLKFPSSSWVLGMALLPVFYTLEPIGLSYKYTCLAQFIPRGPISTWTLGLDGDSSTPHMIQIPITLTWILLTEINHLSFKQHSHSTI